MHNQHFNQIPKVNLKIFFNHFILRFKVTLADTNSQIRVRVPCVQTR
jgi:hypothetical protein